MTKMHLKARLESMLGQIKHVVQAPQSLWWFVGMCSVVVMSATSFTLLYGGAGPTDHTLQTIENEQRISIAIDPSFPPFASYGEPYPEGLDADLGLAIGEALDVPVHFSGQSFDGLYDALYLGHVDIIISALRRDAFRTDWVYYTIPYVDAGQVLVMRSDIENPVKSFSDLVGQTLAVEFGSEGDIAARDYLEEHPDAFTLEQKLSADQALNALTDESVDVALVDRISVGYFVVENNRDFVISAPLVSDKYVIAIRRESWRLAFRVDEIVAALHEDGTLQALIEKWLGVVPTVE